MKQRFKVGDRVVHPDFGPGTINYIFSCLFLTNVHFDKSDLTYLCATHTLKRLIKKKKPKREPRRFWVNLYPNYRLVIHTSMKSATKSRLSTCSGTIEVVEVLKNDDK